MRKHSGIAMLEASGALFILVSLLISGFGLVEYMRISRNLSELINKHVYETAFKPYRVSGDFNTGSGSAVQLDRPALEKYIDDTSKSMSLELTEYLEKVGSNPASSFIIESAFAEIKIDPEDGKAEGLAKTPHTYHKLAGNQSLQSYMDNDIRLENKFTDYSEKEINVSVKDQSETRSYYAIPSAKYSMGRLDNSFNVLEGGGEKADSNFLPTTVLVGVRAGVHLENTFIGSMLELLGQDPFLSEFKVVTLRGEISDEV